MRFYFGFLFFYLPLSLFGQNLLEEEEKIYTNFDMNGELNPNYASVLYDDIVYTVGIIRRFDNSSPDSVILVRFENDKCKFIQELKFPEKVKSSGIISCLYVDKDNLYFISSKRLHIFKKSNNLFEYSKTILSSMDEYNIKGELGYFRKFHVVNDSILYTTEFDELSSKKGCKQMFFGTVNSREMLMKDSIRIPVCGTFLGAVNHIYPMSVSADGNYFAYYNVVNNILQIWDILSKKIDKTFEITLDSSFKINSDSLDLWTEMLDENSKDNISWNLRAQHVLNSSHVNRIYFIDQKRILISIFFKSGFYFKVLDIQSGSISDLSYKVKIDEKYVHWNFESVIVDKNRIFVLTPNYLLKREMENDKVKETWSIKGYKLVKLKYLDK